MKNTELVTMWAKKERNLLMEYREKNACIGLSNMVEEIERIKRSYFSLTEKYDEIVIK